MKYTHVYFDFDGTLCDSFEVFKKAFTVVAEEFKLNTACLDSENLRDLPTKEILKELNVSMLQLPFVVKRGREEVFKLKEKLELFPKTIELLNSLLANNIHVGILTSNSRELVNFLIEDSLLNKISLAKPSPLFGKSKSIKDICKEQEVSLKDFLYVGDETRDIEAAHKAGVDSVAVTYGYNSKKVLLDQKPTHVCDTLQEFLEILA
jgi:phosphoglycolate phosphatase